MIYVIFKDNYRYKPKITKNFKKSLMMHEKINGSIFNNAIYSAKLMIQCLWYDTKDTIYLCLNDANESKA